MEEPGLRTRLGSLRSRRPGGFRLVPPAVRQSALAQDYTQMRAMFMSEPPPFAELMERLAQAEATLNNV